MALNRVEPTIADSQIDANELRDLARRVLRETIDRRVAYSGALDARAHRKKIADLGWMLLTTPVQYGGMGQSFLALQPVYCEMGRALAPTELSGSMAAVDVLAMSAELREASELLAAIGSGKAAVAVAMAGSAMTVDDLQGNAAKVSGLLRSVPDALAATHLLILPDGAVPTSLVVVDLACDGVGVSRVMSWDRTRTLADVKLTDVTATVLLAGGNAIEATAAGRAHLDLAVACDSVGGAAQVLEETINYMATRRQFNRPIGSFQALKHRCADLKVGLELARALTRDACEAYVSRCEGWSCRAAQARLLATSTYHAISEDSIQLHGGIGFTWEHTCHLFLKRALLNEMLGGTPEQHKDRIASELLARAFAFKAGIALPA